MPSIPYKKRKIGHSYLVWFQNSNLFVQMEEPAWFVFRKTAKRNKTETIAREFSDRYDINIAESLTFVTEIRSGIEKMNMTDEPGKAIDDFSEIAKNHSYIPYSTHQYKLANKEVMFSFESRLLEHYLHPLISHLELPYGNKTTHFELFSYQNQVVFRLNGEIKGIWADDESHLVKGSIFMSLINVMYEKSDSDWLMTVHASGITDGHKTILFSAAPGKGKTTIAGLLQARGYQLISDDFVPIDRNSIRAYPFPIAMSVKPGSVDLLSPIFPTLEDLPLNRISPEKSVRFMPPALNLDITNHIFPVQEFVFIEYNTSVDFLWEKLNPINAAKLLLDQSWILPEPANAEVFMEQILNKSFFKLTYSNNEKALDAITNLFDHD